MRVIRVRNVHQALPQGIRLLREDGVLRNSRVGPVLMAPEPVSTVYLVPKERVVLWPERDYNVAFALYEAMWMLAGRNDTKPLDRYVRDYTSRFSDDGVTQHGAYGHRWRDFPSERTVSLDQIQLIIRRLKKNPDDRRCVLQMWSPDNDLDVVDIYQQELKDVPCNLSATFQVSYGKIPNDGCQAECSHPQLNLTVFCRSNDILYGAYYANAFHFSFLLEYVANAIGIAVGRYTQVSVNYHAYLDVLNKFHTIPLNGGDSLENNPYATCEVRPLPLPNGERSDDIFQQLLELADNAPTHWSVNSVNRSSTFADVANRVLMAHQVWREFKGADWAIKQGLDLLAPVRAYDIAASMIQWLKRREPRKP